MRARTTAAARLGLVCTAVALLLPTAPAAAAEEHRIGAFFISYVPDNVTINRGDTLVFVNTDPFSGEGHTLTQATNEASPRFDTGLVGLGESAEVQGVSELQKGKYLFRCMVHDVMTGFLFVGGDPRPIQERLPGLPSG